MYAPYIKFITLWFHADEYFKNEHLFIVCVCHRSAYTPYCSPSASRAPGIELRS